MNIEYIGMVAALLTTSAFVPQVIKIIKHKTTAGISKSMYFVMLTGVILWTIYGVGINSLSIIFANSITAFLQIIILYYKLKYK